MATTATTGPHLPPSIATLRRISRRWDLGLALDVDGVANPPLPGVANHVWFLGQRLVLRIAGHDPASVAALHKEAAILPLAHQAGVRTAKLVAFDPDNALLGASYMLLERVPGTNLGTLGVAPHATPEVYQALGHDLARWHARPIGPADPLGFVDHDPDPNPDPRPTVERLTTSGHLSTELERWLIRWLDRLALAGRTPAQPRVLHGDAAPTNVLVTHAADRYAYAAVIDWGDAAWSDPAADLAKVPLRAVPAALEGYRRVGHRRRRGRHRGSSPLVPPQLGAVGVGSLPTTP